MTSKFGRYTAATVGTVVLVGLLLSLVFRGPGEVAAVWLSAALAIVVQLAAFRVGRLAGENNVTARMGAGAGMRFLTLVTYGFIIAKVLVWPIGPALVSLAAFFFLTTLIDPLFIKS